MFPCHETCRRNNDKPSETRVLPKQCEGSQPKLDNAGTEP
jgi:hypothetical protein